MSVIAGAAAFRLEAEALVETEGGDVGGTDFEGKVAGAVLGGPGQDGFEESGAESLAAGVGTDRHGVELGEVLCAVEKERGGGEGVDFFLWGDGDEGRTQERWFRAGAEVRAVVAWLPLGGFWTNGGEVENRVQIGGLHGADRDRHDCTAERGRGGEPGWKKISASERRR